MTTPVLDNLDLGGNQIINLLLEQLSSDPGSPATGRIWYNTTSKLVKTYDGTTVQTLAFLSAVVASVTAGDSTITIAGSSTAPTVKVAKALDHTYITDFLATVEGVRLDQMTAPTASVSMNSQKLTGLADATNPQDAMNLESTLALMAALGSRDEVAYATAAALPANTYSNGTSGVGATLTANSDGVLSVDSEAPAVGMRILVTSESTASHNGVYVVTQAGSVSLPYILTRSSDFDTALTIGPGVLIPVEAPSGSTAGATNNAKVFLSIAPTPFTVGTSSVTFSAVGGTYTADGTTITLTGTTFSLTSPVAISNGGTGASTAATASVALSLTTNRLPSKFAESVGNASATSFTVTHDLATTDVIVQVWETGGSKRLAICDTTITDANNIVVTFAVAPASNAYRVVVIG